MTDGASVASAMESAPKEASVATQEPDSPVYSSTNIEEFSSTPTEENKNTTGGPVTPSAGSVSDSIESFSTLSGVCDPAFVDVL